MCRYGSAGNYWVSWDAKRCKNKILLINYRMVWVGRSLKDHLIPTPCHGWGRLPLFQIAQSPHPARPWTVNGCLPSQSDPAFHAVLPARAMCSQHIQESPWWIPCSRCFQGGHIPELFSHTPFLQSWTNPFLPQPEKAPQNTESGLVIDIWHSLFSLSKGFIEALNLPQWVSF